MNIILLRAYLASAQFPITAIREIKILKILNHKNVVRLKEIVTSKGSDYNQGKGSIYMVGVTHARACAWG